MIKNQHELRRKLTSKTESKPQIQSKIKEHVAFYKQMLRQNKKDQLFSKEPKIVTNQQYEDDSMLTSNFFEQLSPLSS
jgi:hypothetical protein